MLGTMGGVGLAFLLENLDSTIRTPEDVEGLVALPMLTAIPHISLNGRSNSARPLEPFEKNQPLSLVRPNSAFAESFRALRTTLLLSAPGQAPKVLVITSAVPGEGKSTTASNIAVVLAQYQRRVLLVDADMRRATLQTRLGIGGDEGLSRCLTGVSDFASSRVPNPNLPSLDMLFSGQRPPYPAELLGSDQMRSLIEQWRSEYDHIVIDTPPVLGLSDAVILSTMADAVLLVARCAKTSRQSLSRARDILARVNARTVGMVLNDLDLNSAAHYGYYGYYGDAYKSYYEERALEN
jgi:polysaccharide biosynthesis transport protein